MFKNIGFARLYDELVGHGAAILSPVIANERFRLLLQCGLVHRWHALEIHAAVHRANLGFLGNSLLRHLLLFLLLTFHLACLVHLASSS